LVSTHRVKYWEILGDNLSKAGWSLGWVSAADSEERALWIVDAHWDDRKRFIMHADEKLSAFVELERQVFNGCIKTAEEKQATRKI